MLLKTADAFRDLYLRLSSMIYGIKCLNDFYYIDNDKFKIKRKEEIFMRNDVEYLELLEELEQIIKDAKQSLIGNRCSIDKAEVLGIINDLMEALPDEIKRARAITAEAKTIVNNAKEDAQRTK